MTKPDKDAATIKRLREKIRFLEAQLDTALAGKEAAEQALRDERSAEQARVARRSYGNGARA